MSVCTVCGNELDIGNGNRSPCNKCYERGVLWAAKASLAPTQAATGELKEGLDYREEARRHLEEQAFYAQEQENNKMDPLSDEDILAKALEIRQKRAKQRAAAVAQLTAQINELKKAQAQECLAEVQQAAELHQCNLSTHHDLVDDKFSNAGIVVVPRGTTNAT